MSSSKQAEQIEQAIEAVDWVDLAALPDGEIKHRWSDDADATWPGVDELAGFALVTTTRKPPQAAE